jgi:allophanate hydrolase subunit 2
MSHSLPKEYGLVVLTGGAAGEREEGTPLETEFSVDYLANRTIKQPFMKAPWHGWLAVAIGIVVDTESPSRSSVSLTLQSLPWSLELRREQGGCYRAFKIH